MKVSITYKPTMRLSCTVAKRGFRKSLPVLRCAWSTGQWDPSTVIYGEGTRTVYNAEKAAGRAGITYRKIRGSIKRYIKEYETV